MTFANLEVMLRGNERVFSETLGHEREPAAWTDADVDAVLRKILRAVARTVDPEAAGDRPVALRGLSWIVSPYQDGVMIAFMKADLVVREPDRLKKWLTGQLYQRIQKQRAGAGKFVLHDGPPFSNGDVHIGNALNKVLKDIVVKYKTLRGYWASYVPGWDCHGLPIEQKIQDELGPKLAN